MDGAITQKDSLETALLKTNWSQYKLEPELKILKPDLSILWYLILIDVFMHGAVMNIII